MSEEEWTEETVVPPKKKGFPSWLMFCGGGCLIAVILGVIATFLIVDQVKEAMNPDAQWARLEEAIELDARPPELQLMFGWSIGMDIWMLRDSRGYIVAIYDFGESEAAGRDELFSDEFEGGGLPGLNEIEDAQLDMITVQGREIPVQRFHNTGGFNPGGNDQVSGSGAACFVDITPEGDMGFMMLFMMRDPSQNSDMAEEPIEAEAIQEVLKPFVIGPDHDTYFAPGPHPQSGQSKVDFEEVFEVK